MIHLIQFPKNGALIIIIINWPFMKFTKTEAFILSFLAYSSIHSLRTTYSFIKSYLPSQLDVSITAIGVIDSLLLLFLGIGHFLHAVYPVKKPIKMLWIGSISVALTYLLIPICMRISFLSEYWIFLVLMCVNGYLQSYTWPHLLMMVHHYFDPKKDSILVGFWATDTNCGNIIGYLICQILIKDQGFIWETAMIFAAAFTLLLAILIALRTPELPISTDAKQSLLDSTEQDIQNPEEVQPPNIKTVFKDVNIIMITSTFALNKSVIYGILLWLPLYFKSKPDLSAYSAEIPMTYDVASILGSTFIGYLFSKVNNKGILLNPFMFALLICFTTLKIIDLPVWGYFVSISIVGFCLGGTFNSLSGLVVCELANKIPQAHRRRSLGFFAALTMAVGNVTTALTQILIGFVVGKENQNSIFLIFILYIAVCIVCLVFLTISTRNRQKQIVGEEALD